MKLSIVIPAYNEAKRIGNCLEHLAVAVRANDQPGLLFETIVVDNNSGDDTAQIAQALGTKVIFERINQIARARNAGAADAGGDWFLFVDADTLVSRNTLSEALAAMQSGRFAGGASVLRFDRVPVLWKPLLAFSNAVIIPAFKSTCGCFLFCRSDAFRDIGGFDEKLFAGEDDAFGRALCRWSKTPGLSVAILRRHPPVTSIRKLDLYGSRELLLVMVRYVLFRRRLLRDKTQLHIFYDGRR